MITLHFSGTGNSEYIAQCFSERMGAGTNYDGIKQMNLLDWLLA